VRITAGITVSDVCDPNPKVRLVSIKRNEPDNGQRDGDTSDDIQDTAFGTDDRSSCSARSEAGAAGACTP
jgi:hypothetical protein